MVFCIRTACGSQLHAQPASARVPISSVRTKAMKVQGAARRTPSHSLLLFIIISLVFHALPHVAQPSHDEGAAFTACSNTARFPAMFGFGTSLSDTGNGILSNPLFLPGSRPPYGSTFFGHPTGRFCDGRNMIDFIAEAIGVPYLNPYLKKTVKGTDFARGVNYAVAGATVQKSGELLREGDITFLTTYSLDVQIQWHLSIKRAAQQASSSPPLIPDVVLPGSASFSEALYFIEFGGNDYGTSFLSKHLLPSQNKQPINNSYILSHVVPAVIDKMVDAIELLYANEARNFLVLNIPPEGCAPLFLKLLIGNKDSLGCLEAFNKVDSTHNQLLLSALEVLSSKYLDIHLMYGDIAKAYMSVLQDPFKYGFKETIIACCGAGPKTPLQFSLSKICSPSSFKCEDPSSYVIWDGAHNTDAMYNQVISSITSSQNLICVHSH